jgi:hypothetical protein
MRGLAVSWGFRGLTRFEGKRAKFPKTPFSRNVELQDEL